MFPDLQVDAQIIDWICNWLMWIFQHELNEHHGKLRNQIPHKTTNNTTLHLYDEITQKNTKEKTLIYVKTTYLEWNKREKKDVDEWF